MRYHEIASGVRVPLSFEEQKIIDLANENMLNNENLDERQQEVARLMVSRGLLDRKNGVLTVSNSNMGRF